MDLQNSVSREGIGQDAIVDAAIDIIVRHGFAGLTLRPLAASLGVSVAAISTRMGAKDALIDRVVGLAAQRDKPFFTRWSMLAARIAPGDSAARAAFADLAFRDWTTAGRKQAIFLIELVHHYPPGKSGFLAIEQWLADAGIFWSNVVFGSPSLADLALGYILDEAGFALSAGDEPAYALLRVLCLQRLADGVFLRGGASDGTVERAIAVLEPDQRPAAADDPKRQRIADSAAQIIVAQGMDAATHRSVALAAGVPASTVVYHFGGRDALVVAGLHAVIRRFHGTRDRARAAGPAPVDDAETRDLVKATSMIALASVREASLLPYALDMRRRRGENIRAVDMEWLGFSPSTEVGFDRTAAQVLSIAVFGMRMVAMRREQPERAHYRSAFAALEAWNSARTV